MCIRDRPNTIPSEEYTSEALAVSIFFNSFLDGILPNKPKDTRMTNIKKNEIPPPIIKKNHLKILDSRGFLSAYLRQDFFKGSRKVFTLLVNGLKKTLTGCRLRWKKDKMLFINGFNT